MYEGEKLAVAATEISPKQIPLLEKLKKERDSLILRVKEYEEAIAALEANPDFEKLINTLGKVNRIY